MTTTDFSTSILVNQSPKEVFDAINNVRGWWSESIEGRTDALNAVFLYHYKDMHICKIKIIELIPVRKVVWLVLHNYFNFTQDKTEWNNTRIIFEISEKEGQTELHFTHEGLVPEYECFEACREGWTKYIRQSLPGLITNGKGQANPKEGNNNTYKRLVEEWGQDQ